MSDAKEASEAEHLGNKLLQLCRKKAPEKDLLQVLEPLTLKLREINQSEDGGQMPKLASALTHAHVLKHQSKAIIAHVSSSTSEVFRIFAPEQPYEKEETLQTVYENFNQTLGWLKYAALARGRGGEEEEDGRGRGRGG